LLWLIDFKGKQIFDATVDTNILLCAKGTAKSNHALQIGEDLPQTNPPTSILQGSLNQKAFTLGNTDVQALKAKIETRGVPLKQWDVSIKMGIRTGLNEAFIIDTATKERLCQQDPKSLDIIKPILRGRDIKRYSYEWAGLWVILVKYGFNTELHKYPAILKHLMVYENQLKNRGQCRYSRGSTSTGQHHWLELDNNPKDSYLQEFEREKVIYPDIAEKLCFSLGGNHFYVSNTAYFFTGRSLKYLLVVLNSSLINWYYRYISTQLGEKGIRHFSIYIEQIPIPKISEKEQQPFITLADQILAAKRANAKADTSALEREIDKLVYALYGLTAAEVALVEGR